MKRSRAEELIDDLRVLVAQGADSVAITRLLYRDYAIEPLEQCKGEAHENPHVDNCLQCAPRWGWIGERVRVT